MVFSDLSCTEENSGSQKKSEQSAAHAVILKYIGTSILKYIGTYSLIKSSISFDIWSLIN